MILISVVVLLLFFVLFAESRRLGKKLQIHTQHRRKLEQELAEEELRTAEIEELRELTQTDEYIKQAAKDRLGLVEEGEIRFRAR
ncbi:MAG: septum formation initiator family protein, partial [Lachnospiraceae bacterium]|nr:septum formation initiator family protein [Lachnospiraceae bacterium]